MKVGDIITWSALPRYIAGQGKVVGLPGPAHVQVHWPHGTGGIVALPRSAVRTVNGVEYVAEETS